MKESMALQPQRTYLPAAGRDSLLPLYDLMTKADGRRSGAETTARPSANSIRHRVLDVGCGTGSLNHPTQTPEPGDGCR